MRNQKLYKKKPAKKGKPTYNTIEFEVVNDNIIQLLLQFGMFIIALITLLILICR